MSILNTVNTSYSVCIFFASFSQQMLDFTHPPPPPLSFQSVCYLAGAQYSRHAVTVSQGELDLDVDPPGSFPRDPACHQPIVLARAHHVTDLIQRKICCHFTASIWNMYIKVICLNISLE